MTDTFQSEEDLYRTMPSRFREDLLELDIRAYVSSLWADDWNSAEDSVYDERP
jgi:hypothetical protein